MPGVARSSDVPDEALDAIETLEAGDVPDDDDGSDEAAIEGIRATSREAASSDRFKREAVLDSNVMEADRDAPWPFPKLSFAEPPPTEAGAAPESSAAMLREPAPPPPRAPADPSIKPAPPPARPSFSGPRVQGAPRTSRAPAQKTAPDAGSTSALSWLMPAFFASGLIAAGAALGLLVVGVGAVGLTRGRAERPVAAVPAPVVAPVRAPPVAAPPPEPVAEPTPAEPVVEEAPIEAAPVAKPVKKKAAPVVTAAPAEEEAPTIDVAPPPPPPPAEGDDEEKKKGLFGRKRDK